MTEEELKREERFNKLRHRAERYSGIAMIVAGIVGGCAGAIGGGEITRAYEFFTSHPYLHDFCISGSSIAGGFFGIIIQDKLDPIARYLDRKVKIAELERQANKNKN